MTEICSSLLKCAYDFQTLASGVLAVGAAIIGGAYVLRSSRLPVKAHRAQLDAYERRKAAHISRVFAVELERISTLATQAAATIRVVISSGKEVTEITRSKTMIEPPALIDDVDAMSLLPPHLSRMALSIRRDLLRHNFDMHRAGGSFGDSNFRKHVTNQAENLAIQAKQIGQYFEEHGSRLSKEMLTEASEKPAYRYQSTAG